MENVENLLSVDMRPILVYILKAGAGQFIVTKLERSWC